MHRNDLDRHIDNMDEYRRIEIRARDSHKKPLKDSFAGRLIAYLLIALLFACLILITR